MSQIKINRKLKCIFLLSNLCAVMGCADFLEEEPLSFFNTDDIVKTKEGARAYVDGMYRLLSNDTDAFYRHRSVILITAGTDIARVRESPVFPGLEDYTTQSTNFELRNTWQGLYKVIFSANTVLKGLRNSTNLGSNFKASLEAEARSLRGFSYLLLFNLFGEIPIVEDSELSVSIKKNTIAEIYEFIEQDLNYAVDSDLLPLRYDTVDKGKVTSGAAKMMLAKLYLKMSGFPEFPAQNKIDSFEKAKKLLLEIKDDHGYGLNTILDGGAYGAVSGGYGECFNVYNRFTKETIFDMQSSFNNVADGIASVLWHPSFGALGISNADRTARVNQTNTAICGTREVYPSKTLYDLYAKDQDLRFQWNIADYRIRPGSAGNEKLPLNVTTNQVKLLGMTKYRVTVDPLDIDSPPPYADWRNSPQNFPIYRYADVLLMLAEIENELNNGPNTEAVGYINEVRDRARGTADDSATPNFISIEVAAYNKEDFFELVLDERARELCFEGHRLFDLKRTGKLSEKVSAALGIVISDDYNFPIPQSEINLNPNLGK